MGTDRLAKYVAQEHRFLEKLHPFRIAPSVKEGFWHENSYVLAIQLCSQRLSEFAHQELALDTIKKVFCVIARQLQTIHSLGIIHADVKTDNYMLARRNDPESILTIDFSSAIQLP